MVKYRIKGYKSSGHRYTWHIGQRKRFGIWWSYPSTDTIDYSDCEARLCGIKNKVKISNKYYEVNCDSA